MEFWGVEVKAGQGLKVNPGEGKVIHLSQASLGESKKGNDSVPLYVNINDKKLVLGTLSSTNFPQIQYDVVFEKEFELSHSWKHGSVYFCGYKTDNPVPDEEGFSDEFDSEEDEMPLELENGKLETKVVEAKPAVKLNNAKPASSAKPKVQLVEPTEDVESDEDDDSSDEDSDEAMGMSDDDSEDGSDEDDSESSDEEETPTPKKASGKKRATESAKETPASNKKAKIATPQKTDGKKAGDHTATPHPSKQAGKTANNDKSKGQSPKSAGQVSCQSCTKTFKTDGALDSHKKAKHAAK